MGTHSPALVVTENVIEEVVPSGCRTASKIQRFVKGQVVSSAQVEAYKDRTGVEVPTTDVQPGINAYLGMVVALDDGDATPPPAVAPHVTVGEAVGPGVTSDSVGRKAKAKEKPEVAPEPEAEVAS